MQLITADYLVDIITKYINATIGTRRKITENNFNREPLNVTDEEIVDFIMSIPYFDNKIKDFIFGNIAEPSVIISQTWEIEFIKRCDIWSKDAVWLRSETKDVQMDFEKEQAGIFTLPY